MADYGGGGGGSAIDAAAAAVLSQNEVLLAAPNNAKLTALYPTPGECSSSLAQTVCNSGQLRVTANARNLGGSSNFHISSSNILDVPMLNFTLTIQGNAALPGGNLQYPYCIMPCQEGWGYSLIRSIEVTFSNSNLSNLILDGYALREWTLAQCKDRKARKTLLRNAGRFFVKRLANENDTVQVRGCIPLSFLSWQGGDIETGFPFDARTVNGIIQLQVNWVPNLNGAFSAAPAAAATSDALDRAGGKGTYNLRTLAFDELYVSFRSYQLMDSAFSVGNALALNPQLKYVLPGKWANTYRQNVVGAALGRRNPFPDCVENANVRANDTYRINLELNSCPAGMLQAIGIAVRPVDPGNNATKIDGAGFDPNDAKNWLSSGWNGLHTDSVNYQGSMLLNGILLQYSGQNIINLGSYEEIMAYMRHIYGGDELETYVEAPYENLDLSTGSIGHSKDIFAFPPTLDPTFAVRGDVGVALDGAGRPVINRAGNPPPGRKRDQIYLLPLMHNGKQCFKERHFENLPQYSGSSLTLQLDVCQDSLWKCHRAPTGNVWNNPVGAGVDAAPSRAQFNRTKTAAPVAGGFSGGEICNAACEMTVPPMFVAYNTIEAAYAAITDNNANGIHTKIYTEFEVTITYYIASLLQNANGMVELQI